MKKRKRSKFAQVRHPFLYEVQLANGKKEIKKIFAKVRPATRSATLVLTPAHVRESMRREGVGHTSTCSVAICTYAHADAFYHRVEGHTDFQYARAFLVSKCDKYGLPAECYAYEHNLGSLAKLNDTPGGQKKLLALLERDGPLTIELKPFRQRSEKGRSGKGREKNGSREKQTVKGAKLRKAYMAASMQIGAIPED